ncbi:glycosyltransferase family 2 protein [Hymenobacter arizonensis]|uniref:glycosyltransferase family 2 protein n=1 Tax=Hymenobacter arizonensis TaxID=1227077 RepID=UPI0015A59607|nr:glycosyltransferase family 2 protein [Hymenobacter arizonensis]
MLTIAIPTYNRSKSVKKLLEKLLPQLIPEVKVVVFDNCSSVPVSDIMNDFSHPGVSFVRNKTNVGMAGNFIKCFEACDTKWLWVLGDDDYPYANAVELVFDNIKQWSDASFINFKSLMASERKATYAVVGAKGVIEGLDDFGNLLCISLGVYNMHKLYTGMRFAYQYAYTIAPQVAFLLTGLRDGEVVFSIDELIDFAANDTDAKGFWSWVSLSSVIGSLAELPLNLDGNTLKTFHTHLLTHIKKPNELYEIMVRDAKYNSDEKLRIFKLVYDRSTFGKLFNNRMPSFIFYYSKLWLNKASSKENDAILDLTIQYERIERV